MFTLSIKRCRMNMYHLIICESEFFLCVSTRFDGYVSIGFFEYKMHACVYYNSCDTWYFNVERCMSYIGVASHVMCTYKYTNFISKIRVRSSVLTCMSCSCTSYFGLMKPRRVSMGPACIIENISMLILLSYVGFACI